MFKTEHDLNLRTSGSSVVSKISASDGRVTLAISSTGLGLSSSVECYLCGNT